MSNRRSRAPKSRARIIELKAKRARDGVTTAELIQAMRDKYPEILRIEKDDLIHLGLTTIVTSVCNLNWGGGSSVQADLFNGYDVPQTVSLRGYGANGEERNIKKNIDCLTKDEFQQYVADRTKPTPKKSKRDRELARLFDFIRPHGKGDWTVRDCWNIAQAQAATL